MLAALWSEEGQIDIYGADGEVRMPGRFRPGTATPVDGGYRVSGTWDYVSGCDSATHLALGFMLGDDPSAGELATDFIGVVDYADCEIIDNWDVLGLRGTGSKRVVVEDVFVPEHRTIDSIFKHDAPPAAGRTVHDAAIYREGTIGGLIFSETASVAIGTAWAVLDPLRGEHAHQRLGRDPRRGDVAAPAARLHGAHGAQHGPARARGRQLRAPALRADGAWGAGGRGAGPPPVQ